MDKKHMCHSKQFLFSHKQITAQSKKPNKIDGKQRIAMYLPNYCVE